MTQIKAYSHTRTSHVTHECCVSFIRVIPTGLQTKEGSSNEEPHLKASIGAATSGSRRWLRLACSLKLEVSFAKEPYKGDDILQKRPIILRSLPIEATP